MTPPRSFFVLTLLGCLLALLAGAAYQLTVAEAATCDQSSTKKCDPLDTTPPAVRLTSPDRHAPGQYTSIQGVVEVKATATDNQDIANVKFYAGSIPLGTDTEAPFEARFDTKVWPDWQTSFMKVVATDTIGNTSEDLLYVQVVRTASIPTPNPTPATPTPNPQPSIPTPDTKAPSVKLTSPAPHAPGQYSPISGVITVEAEAADDVGVQRVDFYAGSIALGSATKAPWRASFDTSVWPLGQVSFVKAVAIDGSGNMSSDTIYVQVARSTGTTTPGTATPGTATPAACADGKDNDADGKIDYPADTGCVSRTDTDEVNRAAAAACEDGKDNDGDGKADFPNDPGCSIPADNDESNAAVSGSKLQWSPPSLSNPVTINVPETGGIGGLDPNRDYVLNLGHRKTGLGVSGGRNIVVMGGRITCQDIVDSNLSRGRGIEIWDNKGVVHVEGVQFDNCGTGIAISAPDSVVQVQNTRFDDIDSPWNLMHPDVIQTWRGPKEIRIDRLTADFSSKGFLWMSVNGQFPGRIDQRHVNFRLFRAGGATPDGPHHFTWHPSSTTRSTCSDCWTETGWWQNVYRRRLQDGWGTFDKPGGWEFIPYRVVGADGRRVDVETQGEHDSLVDDNLGRRQGDYMERLTPSLAGERWHWGQPQSGDFVPAGSVGASYRSPGYSG